ncbi:MAG: monovalent cation/H+ antiporter subunit D family protein [Nitrospirales bacterium]
MTGSLLAPLAIVTPLVGALLMGLSRRHPNLRETVTLVTAGLLFLLAVALLPQVLSGARPATILAQPIPGLPLALEVEPLGILFALVASLLWFVTSLYSIGYMRGNHEHHQTRYYVYFAVALSSTMGVAFAGNMLTLFLFYEVLTLSTYPLVTHHGTAEAMRAGRTYLGLLLFTSIGLQLFAILWTWQLAGTLDFVPGGILGGGTGSGALGVLLFLYLFGIGKAALMPLHRWLPAAMVAPTPVSALLHAVAVVKAGVFTVAKVLVYVFGLEQLRQVEASEWAVYVAGATVLSASVVALKQDNLKRRLAYSTVSQLSYVIMAATLLTPLSVVGAALHIAAHAFGKITLFFAAGSIYTASHKTEISQLDGIGRAMPWTMGAFTIGTLSMIGVPPAAGFISKWYILLGALEVGNLFAVAVIVVSTLLNAAYFLPIVYAGFFRSPKPDPHHTAGRHGEAPVLIVAALVITATLTVLFFFLPDVPLWLAYQLIEGAR